MEILLIFQHSWVSYTDVDLDKSYSSFMKRPAPLAPVITFLGKSKDFESAAIHIHQFYPFFYVQLPLSFAPDLYEFAQLIEKSLADIKEPIIHNMEIVEKIPFYGYHTEKSRFIKIEIYNSYYLKQVSNLCFSGKLGVRLQPYEVHLTVFQHFYSMYKLTGMDWLKVSSVSYRPKLTTCSIEAHSTISDIIISESTTYLDNIKLKSVNNIWKDEKGRRIAKGFEFSERMPDMVHTDNLPHNYIRDPKFLIQLNMLRTLENDPQKDVLMLGAVEGAEEFNNVNEANEIYLNDIMDISRPKGFSSSSPISFRQTIDNHFTESLIKAAKRAEKLNLVKYTDPSYEMSYFRTYEYLPEPFSYKEIEENCEYGIRIENPPLFLSSKERSILEGIANPKLLNCNENNLLKTANISENTYLYTVSPPSYTDVLNPEPKPKKERVFKEKIPLPPIMISFLYIEVYPYTREGFLPDPTKDPIRIVVCRLKDDYKHSEQFILETQAQQSYHRNRYETDIINAPTEGELIVYLIEYINSKNPDFIVSFDTENLGIGYIVKRCKRLGLDFNKKISRGPKIPSFPTRMHINVWRTIKNFYKLSNHSFHNSVFELLGVRTIEYTWDTLRDYYSTARYILYDYFLERLHYSAETIDLLEIFPRNISLAQTFSIDLVSVFFRGSQFRVETVLKELTVENDFLLLSATTEQTSKQRELESIPLVLEPDKGVWTDPVVILDFQSLYPSIMIAYNLCYSTCLGRLSSKPYKPFGITHMKREMFSPDQDVFITPNNVGFVKSSSRRGLLPIMLHELLQSRILIKKAMKQYPKGSEEYQKLHSQQLEIKMMCNTTYGYTGAGETGRMPCGDIADSIVALARRTLEAAILLVNSHEKWEAKVIYGDTDSLMVLLEGRSIADAFKIGQEIAQTVTDANPYPVTLVLEKVGCPMLTLAKKHYALHAYDAPGASPVFEAKGIHSVRTSSCLLASHILENSLDLLFKTKDVSRIYSYLQECWSNIHSGKFPVNFFVFNHKMHLGQYTNPPAAVKMVERMIEKDPMAVPMRGERVPYLVLTGEPGRRLLENVASPYEYMKNPSMKINYNYYIDKHVNHIIDHTLGHIGINIYKWYERAVKPAAPIVAGRGNARSSKLDAFVSQARCALCKIRSKIKICQACDSNTQKLALATLEATKEAERKVIEVLDVCKKCSANENEVRCVAVQCPVHYERVKNIEDLGEVAKQLMPHIQVPHMIN